MVVPVFLVEFVYVDVVVSFHALVGFGQELEDESTGMALLQ